MRMHSLLRADIATFGIGATIGAGLFVVTGTAAHDLAGPGVIVSFGLAAIACYFSTMPYVSLPLRQIACSTSLNLRSPPTPGACD